MYKYKSMILQTGFKFFSDKANDEDIANLDKLINEQTALGWELVTYDYMATSSHIKGAFVITFKRKEE